MIKKTLIIFLCFTFFTSGCVNSDYVEPEKRTVVTAMIFDYKNREYNIAFETVGFENESDKVGYRPEYINGSGFDIFSALKAAQNETSSEISLYHCSLILCSEMAFREKKDDIFNFILNTPQISLGAELLLFKNLDGNIFEKEDFLGYKISDAVNLKNIKTDILSIIQDSKEPFFVLVNKDNKVIIGENLGE